LAGTSDYDSFFVKCIDSQIKLNIKGPFANLFWSFKYLDEVRDD
jgi:hypothetical protein